MEPSSAKKTFQDFEDCASKSDIQAQLNAGEKVIFSCKVIKQNKWLMRQTRILLLTNMCLYNVKETSIQRKIAIGRIKAITRSTKEDCLEFVVHVDEEYDYRFESEMRKEIFDAIKYVSFQHTKKNLPVYGVPDSLKDYHTKKKDVIEKNFILPKDQYRIAKEDIYSVEAPKPTPKASPAPAQTTGGMDPQTAFDIQMQQKEMVKERAPSIFVRNTTEKAATLQDFELKAVIGKGSFGKVFLCQKKDTGNLYAMKALRKDVIIDYEQIESTILEKQILQKADHPFLVGMEFVFQSDIRIYFIMKFVRGGELFMHLRKARQFSEHRTKFYSATVALALGHLHKQKIIYRDLKPENILMGEDGYLSLTDFGLAKIIEGDELAQSFCGTPEYLAPEILLETGHAFPVDWWALGVLTYEMIVGFPPFYTGSRDNNQMYDLIKSKPVFFPDAAKHGIHMSDVCKDFINGLLQKDPKNRLGSKGGLEEILAHPFFADLDVGKMLRKEYDPEFVPKLTGDALDVSQFDKVFTSEEVGFTAVPSAAKKQIAKSAAKFKGFDD